MVCQSLEHVEAFTRGFEPSNEPMGFEEGGLCLVTVDQAQDSQWVSTAKHWPYGVSALGALNDTEISGKHIVRTVFCDV